MNFTKHLTVIGATGKLGAPVVKYLHQMGFGLRLIVRSPEKAERLFSGMQGIRICQADLRDKEALREALTGTEYLYLNLSTETLDRNMPFATEREGLANIINTVDRASIKQILMISGLGAFDNVKNGAKPDFIPNIIRKEGQRILKDSGIPYTILHCSWFSDSFVYFRRKDTYSVIGSSVDPLWFTNCYDYSKHLARAIANPLAFFREFPIQGPKGIPHPAAAKEFFSIYAKETKVSILPLGIIRMMAVFNRKMKFLEHMAVYFSRFREDAIAEACGTFEILGKPLLDPAAYAAKLKEEAFYDFMGLGAK